LDIVKSISVWCQIIVLYAKVLNMRVQIKLDKKTSKLLKEVAKAEHKSQGKLLDEILKDFMSWNDNKKSKFVDMCQKEATLKLSVE